MKETCFDKLMLSSFWQTLIISWVLKKNCSWKYRYELIILFKKKSFVNSLWMTNSPCLIISSVLANSLTTLSNTHHHLHINPRPLFHLPEPYLPNNEGKQTLIWAQVTSKWCKVFPKKKNCTPERLKANQFLHPKTLPSSS